MRASFYCPVQERAQILLGLHTRRFSCRIGSARAAVGHQTWWGAFCVASVLGVRPGLRDRVSQAAFQVVGSHPLRGLLQLGMARITSKGTLGRRVGPSLRILPWACRHFRIPVLDQKRRERASMGQVPFDCFASDLGPLPFQRPVVGGGGDDNLAGDDRWGTLSYLHKP